MVQLRDLPGRDLENLRTGIVRAMEIAGFRAYAEDLAQTAILKGCEENDVQFPFTWLRTVALREGLNERRKRTRWREKFGPRIPLALADKACEGNFLDELENHERSVLIENAMGELSVLEIFIVLEKRQGKSFVEIGKKCELPAWKVSDIYWGAIGWLQQLLGDIF